jgi:hypothetical protein
MVGRHNRHRFRIIVAATAATLDAHRLHRLGGGMGRTNQAEKNRKKAGDEQLGQRTTTLEHGRLR